MRPEVARDLDLTESSNAETKTIVSRALGCMGEARVVRYLIDKIGEGLMDDVASTASICLLARMLSSQTMPYMDRVAAYSNFASEYPVVDDLLNLGI